MRCHWCLFLMMMLPCFPVSTVTTTFSFNRFEIYQQVGGLSSWKDWTVCVIRKMSVSEWVTRLAIATPDVWWWHNDNSWSWVSWYLISCSRFVLTKLSVRIYHRIILIIIIVSFLHPTKGAVWNFCPTGLGVKMNLGGNHDFHLGLIDDIVHKNVSTHNDFGAALTC